MLHPKERIHSIVVRGTFNPRIFHPSWLSKNELLSKEEAEKADIRVVHPEVADFKLDWLSFQVTTDRFAATTSDEGHEEILRDLVIGAFKLLSHTPVTALGINYICHFQADDETAWNAIGHTLVPKTGLWENILTDPKTRSVVVQGKRDDGLAGCVIVRIEPSVIHKFGIYLDINDHHDIAQGSKEPSDGAELANLLEKQWQSSRDNSQKILRTIQEEF